MASHRLLSDWVVAARFPSLGAAAAARSALDVNSIETYLAEGLDVMVREEDFERARAIMRNVAPFGETILTCRECGSTNLHAIPRVQLLLAITVVLMIIGALAGQVAFASIAVLAAAAGVAMMPSHRCRSCGWSSTPIAEPRIPPLPIRVDLIERPCARCGTIILATEMRCGVCGQLAR